MEKQHQFLKAQLESTCAAYARKLTSDYNNRVRALNMEFDRRLKGAGLRPPSPDKGELNQLRQQLERVEEDWHRMSDELEQAHEQRDAALRRIDQLSSQLQTAEAKVAELTASQQNAMHSAFAGADGSGDVDSLDALRHQLTQKNCENEELLNTVRRHEKTIAHLERQLTESTNGPSNGSDADSGVHNDADDLRAENKELRSEVERLKIEISTLHGIIIQQEQFPA
jgi:chromosome segregation ATPase